MTFKSISSALCLGVFAVAAGAQTPSAGPGWAAYSGCWEPVSAEGMPVATSARVCVVPDAGSGADLLTIADHKVAERTHVDADGAQHVVSRQGCAGWESATWSANGRRLYFNSEQKCDKGLVRKTTGIFAITTNGQWSNIVNVSAGGGQGLRAIRYSPVTVDSTYPTEVVTALANRDAALDAARIAALTHLTTDDVIEAGKVVDAPVVQAWLAAVKPRFDLDAKALVRLADAGVAPETIDVMIAVSNPDVFRVAATEMGASMSESPAQPQVRRNDGQPYCYSNMMDPWGYNDYEYCDRFSRYGRYDPRYGFGYDPFGYYGFGYGYGYGYNGYGYNGYGYGYGGSTVVVVVKGSSADTQHGRMTKNGYKNDGTSGTTSTGGTPEPSQASHRPSSSSGGTSASSGGGSSGGSSGGGSSSGGSSGGRTAQRKPPTG